MKEEYICKQDLLNQLNLMLNRTSLGEVTANTDISVGSVCSLINDMEPHLLDAEKLKQYDRLEERLQGLYSSDEVNIEMFVDMFIKFTESKDKKEFTGFRILTNEDVALYEKWKKERMK